jgi:transcriptional regulator with XRE-family HTH domain
MSAFSEHIKIRREHLGLSLSQAAKAAGTTKTHLHDLEAGRSSNPGARLLFGLSTALKMPGDVLINVLFEDYRRANNG